jgi:hypothetical protein
MARAKFVKKAQKDIYVYGNSVSYISKKGKSEGKTLSKIDKTIPRDDNDKILINKGESYFWWKFKGYPKQCSKTAPRASQLTHSTYLSTLYGIVEEIEDFSTENAEDLEEFFEQIKEQVENLRDDTQDSLDNMPENLQYSPTAELLQERIDSLENAISEIESIDFDYEEEIEEVLEGEEGEEEEGEDEQNFHIDNYNYEGIADMLSDLEQKQKEKKMEWVQEKLIELQAISFE